MGPFLNNLAAGLEQFCPTFVQVPQQMPYPYITIEAEQILQGLPWGPMIALITIKIWSRYAGTYEILSLAKQVEGFLNDYNPPVLKVSLKILESTLVLLKDGQTRLHSFRIKARLSGDTP